jgi:hypothetical protein
MNHQRCRGCAQVFLWRGPSGRTLCDCCLINGVRGSRYVENIGSQDAPLFVNHNRRYRLDELPGVKLA